MFNIGRYYNCESSALLTFRDVAGTVHRIDKAVIESYDGSKYEADNKLAAFIDGETYVCTNVNPITLKGSVEYFGGQFNHKKEIVDGLNSWLNNNGIVLSNPSYELTLSILEDEAVPEPLDIMIPVRIASWISDRLGCYNEYSAPILKSSVYHLVGELLGVDVAHYISLYPANEFTVECIIPYCNIVIKHNGKDVRDITNNLYDRKFSRDISSTKGSIFQQINKTIVGL